MRLASTMGGRLLACAALGLGLAGCADDGNTMPSGTTGDGGLPDGSSSEGGEGGGGDASMAPVVEVEVSRNPDNLLSMFVDVRADAPVTLELEVEGPGLMRTWMSGDASTMHSFEVWGLRADSTYTLTARASDAAGAALDPVEESYDSPALPDDLPPMEMTGTPGAGYTLFSVFRWNPTVDNEWGLLLILDEDGEVVWLHRDTPAPGDARMLDNGHILYAADNEKLVEVDMMGRVVLERTAEDMGTDTVHHEVFPLDDGHLVFLSSELHADVAGYMDMDGMPVSEDVVSDVVVEIDDQGAIVHEHDLFDVLDPLRTTSDFFSPFWATRYVDESAAPRDWTHGNAVILDDADDSFILSLRHQDWLVKLDRESGDVIWRFGNDGDFTLEGGGAMPSRQHAPELLADGRLLLFDNGNASQESRAVIYTLDETTMTATEDWTFSDGSFAPFVGDADMLEDGHVLAAFGGLVADPATPLGDPSNLKSARLVEVTGDADPEVVWQLDIADDAETDPVGYTVYRAERLEALYP